MLQHDNKGTFRLAALQSKAGKALLQRCGRHPRDISSIVVVDREKCFVKSEAILRIAQELEIPFSVVGHLGYALPLFLRDVLYDQVANNRYSIFGKSQSCRLSDTRFAERFYF